MHSSLEADRPARAAHATAADAADLQGLRTLWDNSNIVESYSGVTTPLTFSFARGAYQRVYTELCRLLGVPEAVLTDQAAVFANLLGLIRGRVYYNLLNWYRALALLPGFRANRRFMEQMMGVAEGLPEAVARDLAAARWTSRLGDGLRLAASSGRLVLAHFTLARRTQRFLARLEGALSHAGPDLAELRPEELAAYYRNLERQLLAHWDAPLLNDFLAMIASGLLRRALAGWCGDSLVGLYNDLLCGAGDARCAQPAVRIRELAELARRDPALVEALCEGGPADVAAQARRSPEFSAALQAYLAQFGDRCLEELKLESRTLHDDPDVLYRGIGRLAASEPPATAASALARQRREDAERRVAAALGRRFVRRLLFAWMLRTARARIRDRESLRFERTRVFARARAIFLAVGSQLARRGHLDDPRDVLYLQTDEIWGFIEGTAACADLRELSALRKAEFSRYAQLDPPPRRFETIGPVAASAIYACAAPAADAGGGERFGLAGSPGLVRGRVRVIHDPRGAPFVAGEILVAERTDPGWIVLYSAAAGLVIERGSLLSHSMIVARELGIPAVAALPEATRWLHDGDWVEVDGGRGVVRRIAAPG